MRFLVEFTGDLEWASLVFLDESGLYRAEKSVGPRMSLITLDLEADLLLSSGRWHHHVPKSPYFLPSFKSHEDTRGDNRNASPGGRRSQRV